MFALYRHLNRSPRDSLSMSTIIVSVTFLRVEKTFILHMEKR